MHSGELAVSVLTMSRWSPAEAEQASAVEVPYSTVQLSVGEQGNNWSQQGNATRSTSEQ